MAQALPQDHLESDVTTSAAPAKEGLNNPAHYLITARYIEGLKDMAKSDSARVVFMPVQTSRVLGNAGAIKEIFSRIRENDLGSNLAHQMLAAS